MSELFTKLPDTSLPIFHKRREKDVLFYSAGYLLRVEKNYRQEFLEGTKGWKLIKSHALAQSSLPKSWDNEYQPVSLHLYLTRLCNLMCNYCFSSPGNADPQLISPSTDAIISGARMVAENCQAAGRPMTLVCHGGGEPTQSKDLLQIVSSIRRICQQKEIPIFTYLATNGVMGKTKASEICGAFDLIGLSCDGPPQVQDQQRPLLNGRGSSRYIEQTTSIFNENHQPFEVRATLTSNSWGQMPIIADYFIKNIHPEAINVELVYQSSEPPLKRTEINQFLEKYFAAQEYCKEFDIPWRTSAIRPKHRHRQYCHIFQDTLQIVPGDVASLCFLDNDRHDCSKRQTQIAFFDKNKDKWFVDHPNIDTIREKIMVDEERCLECFVSSHCHRSCPEVCPLDEKQASEADVRCQLNQYMFDEHLQRAADRLSEVCESNHLVSAGMEIKEC